ncbi:cell wall metabolism sensor histidine kinase WalK [Pedobacter sp. L105]|uniref:sensor histidine kinase n=1 Tax=Pedobacter sp. L105 TaxID=1641871 RepID=UPI00131D6CCB|nr:HAMP domain-containing sensor histidine kinase [Pedobacter sp. L105]
MLKNTRFIVLVCTAAIVIVLLLQFYWISSYYQVNQATFEKEVNMAFEDAIQKEFSLRCDTIQHLIALHLMDTTAFKINGEYDPKHRVYQYYLSTASRDIHPDDKILSTSMSDGRLNKPLMNGDTIFKRKIAERMAFAMRSEDLEHHIVYYRTQKLGDYIDQCIIRYDFDTTRLRPVLKHYLNERNIHVPFKFYIRETDSTFNRSQFSPKLLAKFPFITKSYPTFKQRSKQQYVRAMFTNPVSYVLERMGLMFAGSLLIIVVVALSLLWIVRLLFAEKRLSAIKNDFISNITHELKTPIAGASAAIEALIGFDVLDDREKTSRYLQHGKNELERLSALVDKVLNISIYENQQFTIRPILFDVESTVKTMLINFASAPGKVVNWSYANHTTIVLLNADQLYFQHAVSNIIDNAIKYAGDEVTIEVDCVIKNAFFVISVKDNGIGIAAQDLSLVFEKFYRVPHHEQHQIKGHGLGLNYVKSIIERHSGWCSIESEYGKGSIFSLGWPI